MEEWIKQAISYKAGNGRGAQAEVARLLTDECGWPAGRGKLNKLCKGGQNISAKDMYDISFVTGYPIPPSNDGDKALSDFMELYKAAPPHIRSAALELASLFLQKSKQNNAY